MKRYLLSTIRNVSDRDRYLATWQRLRDAVIDRGGRAWIFAGFDDSSRFIEFIEWQQTDVGVGFIDDDVVNTARSELEHFGAGAQQQWKEVESR